MYTGTSYKSFFLCRSINLTYLKFWSLGLPCKSVTNGLKKKKKTFTLFRSPLGNKKAKDHFFKKDYTRLIGGTTNSIKASLLLFWTIQQMRGIKVKAKMKKIVEKKSNKTITFFD